MANIGPLEAFQLNSPNLANTAAGYEDTKAAVEASDAALRAAERAHDRADRRRRTAVDMALEQVHGAVTEDTDPVDYLVAAASVLNDGVLVDYGDMLRNMRAAMLEGPIPIAVVSTTTSAVAVGRTRGDMRISREDIGRHGPRRLDAISFGIPMDELHQFGVANYDHYEMNPYVHPFGYSGTRASEPFMVSVLQHITAIRATGKRTGVRAAIADAEQATIQSEGTGFEEFVERSIDAAGMVPIIAYGYHAVAGVLRNVGKQAETGKLAKVDPAQIAATAINIDIDPADVAPSRSKVRTGLEAAFVQGIGALIGSQVNVDIGGMLGASPGFRIDYAPPAVTAKVMEYLQAVDRVPAIAHDALRPIFAESINGSADRFTRATVRVASALGNLLRTEINPDALLPSESDVSVSSSAAKRVYL